MTAGTGREHGNVDGPFYCDRVVRVATGNGQIREKITFLQVREFCIIWSGKSQEFSVFISLVFRRKDLCEARVNSEVSSFFQMSAHEDTLYPPVVAFGGQEQN